MNNMVCIIGSNRGIGLALVIEYLSYGWTVYGVCRTPSQNLSDLAESNDNLHILPNIDVTKSEDIIRLCTELPKECSEVIHNAGILRGDTVDNAHDEEILDAVYREYTRPLKHPSCLKITPHSSLNKVGIITSRMGSIGDCSRPGMLGYRDFQSSGQHGG